MNVERATTWSNQAHCDNSLDVFSVVAVVLGTLVVMMCRVVSFIAGCTGTLPHVEEKHRAQSNLMVIPLIELGHQARVKGSVAIQAACELPCDSASTVGI